MAPENLEPVLIINNSQWHTNGLVFPIWSPESRIGMVDWLMSSEYLHESCFMSMYELLVTTTTPAGTPNYTMKNCVVIDIGGDDNSKMVFRFDTVEQKDSLAQYLIKIMCDDETDWFLNPDVVVTRSGLDSELEQLKTHVDPMAYL